MLELQLNMVIGAAPATMARLTGTIHCVRGGRTSDYHVRLHDSAGGIWGQGHLRGHPRWSEPLTGLAARCIGAVPAKATAFDVSVVRCAGVVLKLDRRYLTELHVPMTDGRPFGLLPPSAGRHSPQSPWQLAQWCLADDAWGQLAEPPMPKPITVQVHHSGAIQYCRISELPAEAQDHFERWAFSRGRPEVAGVPDAAFVDDVEAYFGSGTCLSPATSAR